MSIDGDNGYHRCVCGVLAFEPNHCARCEDESTVTAGAPLTYLCGECENHCPQCEETICEYHWSESAGMCCECDAKLNGPSDAELPTFDEALRRSL